MDQRKWARIMIPYLPKLCSDGQLAHLMRIPLTCHYQWPHGRRRQRVARRQWQRWSQAAARGLGQPPDGHWSSLALSSCQQYPPLYCHTTVQWWQRKRRALTRFGFTVGKLSFPDYNENFKSKKRSWNWRCTKLKVVLFTNVLNDVTAAALFLVFFLQLVAEKKTSKQWSCDVIKNVLT